MARVFLSHTGSDDAIATDVHQWLVGRGHEVFLDHDLRDGVAMGAEWEQRLHERLRWADALLCVVSPAFIESTWCSAEIGAARSRGTLILPLSTRPGLIHPLLGFIQHVALSDEGRWEKLAATLHRIQYGGGVGWPDDRSPYPGLRPFELDMRQAFFGRGAEISELAGLLRSPAQRSEHALLLVVGPSGSGKSSLVRAGLVPSMSEEPDWWCLPPVLPGIEPALALSRELARAARRVGLSWTVARIRRRLEDEGFTEVADELLLAINDGQARRMLVTLDQLEELLTLTPRDRRAAFADLIRHALTESVQFVATLRPEFLEALLADPDLGSVPTHVTALRPLSRDALREVIERPARLARIRIDDELVGRLVADTAAGDALPLLAFTLAQLTQDLPVGDGEARAISAARYDQLGGVQGAIVMQADLALGEAVTATGRSEDRVIDGLLRLVTVDEHGHPTRRRVARTDLPVEVVTELDAFVGRRLLVTDTADGDVVFGVAHEAFLSSWPPVAAAIRERTVALRARGAVEEAADLGDREQRAHIRLWERGQLAAAVTDLGVTRSARLRTRPVQTHRVDLSDRAREFLAASIRRDRRRRGTATTVLSVLLAVAIVAAGIAVVRQREAEDQQRLATARQLMSQADSVRAPDPRTALRLGIAAHQVHPDEQTTGALVAGLNETPYAGTLTAHSAVVYGVSFTDDGAYMATSGNDGHVTLWDLRGGELPRQVGEPLASDAELIGTAVFSPDGTLLATPRHSDNSVVLWDIRVPGHPVPLGDPLPSGAEQFWGVRFSPDGGLLALGGSSPATVTLWDIRDPANVSRLGDTIVAGESMDLVEFDQSGRFLLTGGDDEDFVHELVRWDLEDPVTHRRLGEPMTYETPAVFDVGTGIFASVSEEFDSEVLLTSVEAASVRPSGTVSTYGSGVDTIAFSPDGETLAVATRGERNDESLVGRWDITDPADPVDLSVDWSEADGDSASGISSLDNFVRVAQLHEIVFAADPDMLLTISGDDKQLTRWDFSDPTRPRQEGPPIVGATGLGPAVVLLPDGRSVATARADGSLVLWNVSIEGAPATAGTMDTGEGSVSAVRYAPGGDTLDVGLGNGEVQTWHLEDPTAPNGAGIFAPDPLGDSAAVAFDSSGSLVAHSGAESVTITDLGDTSRVTSITKPYFPAREGDGRVADLEFSPDGDVLALAVSAGFGGYAVLYDTSDPMHPRRLGPALDPIDFGQELAFTPDGRTLAFGGVPGVLLFDVTEPGDAKQVGGILAETGDIASMAFSPDGQLLAIGTDDDFAVTLWDVSDPAQPTRIGLPLSGHGDRVTVVAFAPDGRTLATGDAQGVVGFWDLTDSTRPRQLGSPQSLHDGSVNALAFAADSSAMASGGADGAVVVTGFDALLDLRKHAAARACDRIGSGLSREEWERYIPNLPYVATCADDN